MAKKANATGTGLKTKLKEGPAAPAVRVMASELLNLTPDEFEIHVDNVVSANLAIEKSEKNADDTPRPHLGKVTYGVSSKVQEIFEQKAAYTETLIEHMEEQINASNLNERQRLIASYIVGSLDRNGYLRDDPYNLACDISFKESSNYDEEEVIQVLKVIQQMDPVGIGARDLKECLLLQLAQRHTQYTPLATRIVGKCFKDMLNNRRDHIAKALGITIEEVNTVYAREIRKLDPKPAGAFDSSDADAGVQVTPTFIIDIEDDQITYEIPNRIPELHISQSYKDAVVELDKHKDQSNKEKEEEGTLSDKIEKADIFISALEMRQETLRQTIEAIIHIQRDFFLNNGDEQLLKPMKLEDLSKRTGRSTSVLSRATSGKYISTPWGIMPMRELFSESLTTVNDEGQVVEVSTRAVKNRLKALIDGEDKSKPLADAILCDLLNKEGFKISRRTVAKYRDQMDIPVAQHRRQFGGIQ